MERIWKLKNKKKRIHWTLSWWKRYTLFSRELPIHDGRSIFHHSHLRGCLLRFKMASTARGSILWSSNLHGHKWKTTCVSRTLIWRSSFTQPLSHCSSFRKRDELRLLYLQTLLFVYLFLSPTQVKHNNWRRWVKRKVQSERPSFVVDSIVTKWYLL